MWTENQAQIKIKKIAPMAVLYKTPLGRNQASKSKFGANHPLCFINLLLQEPFIIEASFIYFLKQIFDSRAFSYLCLNRILFKKSHQHNLGMIFPFFSEIQKKKNPQKLFFYFHESSTKSKCPLLYFSKHSRNEYCT
jgi:hypothetical protein